MIELFGMEMGTIFQGGTFVGIAIMTATVLRAFITGIPERKRAENEAKALNTAEMAAVISDYALRQKETRAEVHALRNELQAALGKLHETALESARRGDKVNTILFILGMVMDRLAERDPKDQVLMQARQLLSRIDTNREDALDPDKSASLNNAEHAVNDARQTLASTKTTYDEVKKSEEENGNDK